jgi:putative endonuclease
MMKCGVYILLCGNGRYYVGSTNDLDRRLVEHGDCRVKATKNVQPVRLAAFIAQASLTNARRLERNIKKQKSRLYVEKMIRAASSVG